MQQIRQKS